MPRLQAHCPNIHFQTVEFEVIAAVSINTTQVSTQNFSFGGGGLTLSL